MSTIAADHHDHDAHHGPAKGLMRWVFTTNHQDIKTAWISQI